MGKIALSYEYVYNYFKENGCELLSDSYINSKTKMKYICNCGNEDYTTLDNFKKMKKCKVCRKKERNNKTKLSYECVYNYFKSNGCELLETEYINAHSKMKYSCNKCKNKNYISWSNFKSGYRCNKCAIKKRSENQRISFDIVYNYFKEQNCELLETEYINNKTKMKYRCICNNISYIGFYSFKKGVRCSKCFGNEKLTYEYVYDYFKENACELLEELYINAKTKMKYKCKCGTASEISFDCFKRGRRCFLCKINSLSGNNNYRYKPNREEIKLNNRLRICTIRKKSWIKTHLKNDPNYNDYLKNPENYNIDHIIPISAFSKILLEQNLDENKIKKIANQKENLQILSIKENMRKKDKFNEEELNNYIKKYYK